MAAHEHPVHDTPAFVDEHDLWWELEYGVELP